MKSVNSLPFSILKDALFAGGFLTSLYAIEHPQHCLPAFAATEVMMGGVGAIQAARLAERAMDRLSGKEGALMAVGQLCFMSTSCHAVGEQVNYALNTLPDLYYIAKMSSRQR